MFLDTLSSPACWFPKQKYIPASVREVSIFYESPDATHLFLGSPCFRFRTTSRILCFSHKCENKLLAEKTFGVWRYSQTRSTEGRYGTYPPFCSQVWTVASWTTVGRSHPTGSVLVESCFVTNACGCIGFAQECISMDNGNASTDLVGQRHLK